ncbi:YceI family protein [Hyphomonas sp. WL0036]|uniref:YceI family protein n=1 Tax=Hyphomonas sediminis TaxID=2866160 RepID=UPI001C803227|nr:YceI family protein [Hyphomonas sediminis]MBY9067665.1 YceI family protein [Hyphomonas sediminis]
MRLLILSAVSALALAACSETTPAAPAAEAPAAEATVETAAAPEAAVEYGAAGTYVMDPTHTSVTFKVGHFGLSDYTARFKKVDGTLQFNPEDPAANSISVTIDPLSVETDYPADYKAGHPDSVYGSWNEDLGRNANWLNGDSFPEITFTSTSVTQDTASTGKVTGDLTFLGVTKPVTLDVTYNGKANFPWAPDADKIGFSATTTLKRSDFGNSTYAPNITDEVEIIIETELQQVVEPAPAE